MELKVKLMICYSLYIPVFSLINSDAKVTELCNSLFSLKINSFIQGLLVFIWVCGFHSQPHLVLLELHESSVTDLIEPYLAQVFLMVILLRNHGGGLYGLKKDLGLCLFIKNC